ncbi:hypothetical protein SNE40_002920 [Patella caerulea]|uniref:Uncharacterized protein n=1 Tax=Patella caerulea TaxID=87958 RepID=A0AAN8K724_PATCE
MWAYKNGTVVSRAGKSSGKYRSWFNIKHDESCGNDIMSLEWEKQPSSEEQTEEQTSETTDSLEIVNSVIAQLTEKEKRELYEAKQDELKKLTDFQTYMEVKDEGQPTYFNKVGYH